MRPVATLISVGVVIGSLVPSRAVPGLVPDYALHGAAYSGVAFVWLLAAVWCPGQRGPANVHAMRVRAAAVVAVVIAMGTIVELAQHFVDRTTDPRDLIANIAGVGLGWIAWNWLTGICHRAVTVAERQPAHPA